MLGEPLIHVVIGSNPAALDQRMIFLQHAFPEEFRLFLECSPQVFVVSRIRDWIRSQSGNVLQLEPLSEEVT